MELNQGREKLETELRRVEEYHAIAEKEGKPGESEIIKKDTEKVKKWLEGELERVKETIRVRREVAIVRGSIEVIIPSR